MLELYFFRNVSNYDELREKTQKACTRNSVNKRKVRIVKTIILEGKNNNKYFEKIRSDNKFVIENMRLMKVEAGIWNCIELITEDKALVIMADGYPYPKYVALRM